MSDEHFVPNNWIKTSAKTPELEVKVWIYCEKYPDILDDDYEKKTKTNPIVVSDSELDRRRLGREWHKNNPYKIAYLYQTAFAGKKWMTQVPRDSAQGQIIELLDVPYWMPLTNPCK